MTYPSDDLIWKIYICWYQNIKDNIDAIVSILMERGMDSIVA